MKKLPLKMYICMLAAIIFISSSAQAAQWKTLRTGSEGHDVYALKLLLLHRKYDPGEINTIFDNKTAEALISFQKQHGLSPNGTTGPGTWNKLISMVGMSSESPEDNNAIKAVQYLLKNKYSFSSLDTDGNYDLGTKAAILLFQSNYNIGVNGAAGIDGVVGAKTWSYLIRDSEISDNRSWVICIEFKHDRGLLGRLYLYDAAGALMLEMPCLGQSMTMNTDWREQNANTPLGCFRAKVSHRGRNLLEYGKYQCIELNDDDVKAVTNGRNGILIHSGANKFKHKPDYQMPQKYSNIRAQNIQGLDQTHGCVRISDVDHARLDDLLKGHSRGIVSISEISTTS